MANIENPAAIFSAEGLKIFIEAIREANGNGGNNSIGFNGDSGNNGGNGDEKEIDGLVNLFLENQNLQQPKTQNNMVLIADLVEEFLRYGTKNAVQIRDVLTMNGFNYNQKSMANLMNGVIKRKPNIIKVGRGIYTLESEAGSNE